MSCASEVIYCEKFSDMLIVLVLQAEDLAMSAPSPSGICLIGKVFGEHGDPDINMCLA